MKHWIIPIGIIITIIFNACKEEDGSHLYFLPGEFEEQEAVWLGWQDYEDFYATGFEMIKYLKPTVRINIVSESDSVLDVCIDYLLSNSLDTAGIQFYVLENNDFWLRDHGAIFTINQLGQSIAVDFNWSNYGYHDWLLHLFDGDQALADSTYYETDEGEIGWVDNFIGDMERLPVLKSWISIEGGALDVNGRGVMLLNEPLTFSRNPTSTKEELELEFHRVLGIKKVIWLGDGLAEDPHVWRTIIEDYVGLGTGGHIDEYARFVDPSTILLAWVEDSEKNSHPLKRINYERMMYNYELLSQATDHDGQPFTIIKVPLPDPITQPIVLLEEWEEEEGYNIPAIYFPESDGWSPGDTVQRVAAASYLNFFISNGVVLIPSYLKYGGSKEKESEVGELFNQLFPNRKIIFIDAMSLNWQGGGIHCGTMQQAKRRYLSVKSN